MISTTRLSRRLGLGYKGKKEIRSGTSERKLFSTIKMGVSSNDVGKNCVRVIFVDKYQDLVFQNCLLALMWGCGQLNTHF